MVEKCDAFVAVPNSSLVHVNPILIAPVNAVVSRVGSVKEMSSLYRARLAGTGTQQTMLMQQEQLEISLHSRL